MSEQNLTIDERMDILKSVGEEIIGLEELPALLESNENLICYDGMEPSGKLHIAQGTMRAINTNKMIKAGFHFKFYVADWFAYLNKKFGGNMENIQKAGKYFIEVWEACGMDLDNVEFVWASNLVKTDGYWDTVMQIAQNTTLNRILRCTQIMGRNEKDKLYASQILYPCMQATDIFKLGARVTQLGMDQRKVNMLARTIAQDLGMWKPIVISNHMLMGLLTPQGDYSDPLEKAIAMKMSKSKPDSAIFMDDTKEEIERKIRKAYCPEGEVECNPILEYCKYIIFNAHYLKGHEDILKDGFVIERPDKFGGNIIYQTYEELENDYKSKNLYPLDLKNAVTKYLDMLIDPVRKHFEEDIDAKNLLAEIKTFSITR